MNRTVNEYLGNQLEFRSEFNFSMVLKQNIWEHYKYWTIITILIKRGR